MNKANNANNALEVEPRDGGNFKVFLNGLHVANLVRIPTFSAEYEGLKDRWQVISLTSRRKNGRKRFEYPEEAIQSYFGRKATLREVR